MTSTASGHARHRLDEVIHAPVRFSIVASLAGATRRSSPRCATPWKVSDSVLSRQVSTFEAAGYVKVRKGYVGKRPRTWLSLTAAGRAAYERHLTAFRAIANGSG